VIFQEKLLKVLKCYNFLWVQRRHNCSPTASFEDCVMTLYLIKVHLQKFLPIPITQKCQILSCDSLVANERYCGQASEWTAQEMWFNSQQVQNIFLLPKGSRPTVRPTDSLIQRAAGWIPLGRKAEGKIMWSCTPLLLCIIHWAKLSITRDREYLILITRFLIYLPLWKKVYFVSEMCRLISRIKAYWAAWICWSDSYKHHCWWDLTLLISAHLLKWTYNREFKSVSRSGLISDINP